MVSNREKVEYHRVHKVMYIHLTWIHNARRLTKLLKYKIEMDAKGER